MSFVFSFGFQLKSETSGNVPFGILFHLLSGLGTDYKRSRNKSGRIYGPGAKECSKKTEVFNSFLMC